MSGEVTVTIHTFTTEEIAGLVEELLAKGYEQTKARVLTTLEAVLDKKGLGNEPVGRLVTYALDDVRRTLLDVVARHVPEVTPERLEQAYNERGRAETRQTAYRLRQRKANIEAELRHVSRELEFYGPIAERGGSVETLGR